MRVLHLWDVYAPGLFDHSLAICREAGIPASLACMTLVDDGAEAPDVRFVRRRRLVGGSSGLAARVAARARAMLDERRFRRLAEREIARFEPDILHVHYGTTAAILEPSEPVLSRPFLLSFYGFDISQGVRDARIRSAYQRLMKRRPLVHVLCAEAAERAIELGAASERLVDANLPLPVEKYPYVGVEGAVERWLIPARFVDKKGHEVLLRAFRAHLSDHPGDRLTCWGYGDGERLRRRVAELGLADRVAVVNNEGQGPFDAAYLAQLRRHDAVLAPSIRTPRGDDEGGPALTAVLAQVAGKPVIVSDFPGHERSVTHGVEGLVVRQGDSEALREAMGELAADPEAARRMGRAGRERALREFDRSAYRDALLGWYRSLA
ncbi:MAG TPA: glycosyltransferase [Sphingomicrobium sp.]|nr:glycosyltransferase [Sphingomicrobium sp.]